MMNMFSLIADQVRTQQELFDDEGRIMEALLKSGYHLHEADAALTLMQTLVQRKVDNIFEPERVSNPVRTRTMTREERKRFAADAFGFVLKLTRLGIISEDQREDVFERAMSEFRGRITIDVVKMLFAFTLFTGPADPEHSVQSRAVRNMNWN